MAFKRFKTNTRLWLLISFALFVPPWFIGHIDKQGVVPAAGLFVVAFSDPANLGEVVGAIFVCILSFGVPALAIGWILHCPIVMVANYVKGRRCRAA
jgi:hypothetical protein